MFYHGGVDSRIGDKFAPCKFFGSKMPTGRFPFRRTFEFLNAGKLILKSDVKSLLINFTNQPESLGLR